MKSYLSGIQWLSKHEEEREGERERDRRDLDLHQDANGLLVAAITLVVDLNKRTEIGTALHLPQALSLSHF
jgi:hypothetical protein